MKEERPLPLADETSAGFWDAAREGRLAIQRCADCRRWNHAPTLACPVCGSFMLGCEDASGKSRLPINTGGGALGEGRLHGITQLAEAVIQVTDRGGERQIPGASRAIATISNGLAKATGFIFSRDPG